jgi:hypothetical protein
VDEDSLSQSHQTQEGGIVAPEALSGGLVLLRQSGLMLPVLRMAAFANGEAAEAGGGEGEGLALPVLAVTVFVSNGFSPGEAARLADGLNAFLGLLDHNAVAGLAGAGGEFGGPGRGSPSAADLEMLASYGLAPPPEGTPSPGGNLGVWKCPSSWSSLLSFQAPSKELY